VKAWRRSWVWKLEELLVSGGAEANAIYSANFFGNGLGGLGYESSSAFAASNAQAGGYGGGPGGLWFGGVNAAA